MSKGESFKRYKSRRKPASSKPITGLRCPACKGNTVQRDVSPEDNWYVEFCVGGQIQVATRVNERVVFESVDCEYWGVGWIGGKRK